MYQVISSLCRLYYLARGKNRCATREPAGSRSRNIGKPEFKESPALALYGLDTDLVVPCGIPPAPVWPISPEERRKGERGSTEPSYLHEETSSQVFWWGETRTFSLVLNVIPHTHAQLVAATHHSKERA